MLKHRNTNTQTWPGSLCPPAVSSNQSHGEYPDCRSERESGGEASLLVSPLVVAGIVIGLVLFLSCITIIVGSLRKDSRLRNPHLRASYGQSAALVLRPAIWCIFSSKCHLGSQQSVERWPRTWSHFELNSVAPCITLLRWSDCKISGSLILDISLVGASYNWWNTPTHLPCLLLWNSLHPQYRAQYSLPKSLAGFPRECKYFKALSKYETIVAARTLNGSIEKMNYLICLICCFFTSARVLFAKKLHPLRCFFFCQDITTCLCFAGLDGFSYGGSVGELRSTCLEDFPPGLDFDSYRDTLSQINNLYPDSPPR